MEGITKRPFSFLTKPLEPFNEVELAHVTVSVQEGPDIHNVIGLDLLRCYNFVIDLRKGEMHLFPRQDKIARIPALEDALGIRFEFMPGECRVFKRRFAIPGG